MKNCILFLAIGLASAAAGAPQDDPDEESESPASPASATVAPRNYYGNIARRLGDMLPKFHVLQRRLDDEMSQRAWTNLVTFYDFDHSVFLKSDLDAFAVREKTLDDEIRAGDVSFGFEVYNLYVERLRERIDFATNLLLKTEWDVSVDESYRVKRKDAPWPATRAEAEEHWRKRMKNEVLVSRISRELDEEEARKKKERRAGEKDDGKSEKEKEIEKDKHKPTYTSDLDLIKS